MKRDLTTKVMTKCKDVFSDICNVNLFGSRKVIRPEDLEVAESNVVYQDMAGVFREHRMDVRMKHKVSNAEIALYCLEKSRITGSSLYIWQDKVMKNVKGIKVIFGILWIIFSLQNEKMLGG